MVAEHELSLRGQIKVDFETAPKQPASGLVDMHMNATVTVTEKYVSVNILSLGSHSDTMLLEKDKHAGPCPTMVAVKVKPLSGTFGQPRCSRASDAGHLELTSDSTSSRKVSMDTGVSAPNAPNAKVTAEGGKSKNIQSKRSIDDFSWAGDHDYLSARYSGTANNWKTPLGLKKNPIIPKSTFRHRKFREFPYSDGATGFVNPDPDHVMSWRRNPKEENISFELTLSGRVGYIMYDPKMPWQGKYLYNCRAIGWGPQVWSASDSNKLEI